MYTIGLIIMAYSIIQFLNKFVHLLKDNQSRLKRFDYLTECFISFLLFLFFFNYIVL